MANATEEEVMLRLIYGAKGSGKTGKLIELADQAMKNCDGEVVFLTDTDRYRFKVNYNIRLINVCEYDVENADELIGLVRGIIAGNADVQHVFIDGVHRMTGQDFEHLEPFFVKLKKVSRDHDVTMVLTISNDELPAYLADCEYIKA
ncbi:MAG: hypothetical protein IJX70_04150 [Clostridia bacterium]|nr:hypothetical protein [Clostridia bacterium]